jgi:hypothetical protein
VKLEGWTCADGRIVDHEIPPLPLFCVSAGIIGLTGEWFVSAGIIGLRGEKAAVSSEFVADSSEKRRFLAKNVLGKPFARRSLGKAGWCCEVTENDNMCGTVL